MSIFRVHFYNIKSFLLCVYFDSYCNNTFLFYFHKHSMFNIDIIYIIMLYMYITKVILGRFEMQCISVRVCMLCVSCSFF